MGVYEGLGRISAILFYENKDKGNYGNLCHCAGKYIVEINTLHSLEEQIKTLIHEAFHLAMPFFNNRNIFYRVPVPNEEDRLLVIEEEAEIERLTDEVYVCQPILVDYLRRVISYRANNVIGNGIYSLSFRTCFIPSPREYINSPARI